MASLFRPEVAEAQRQTWLGQVQLVRPLSLTVFTVGVLGMLALVLAFLFFGEYTRKARIGGVLVPDLGVIRLVPPVSGPVLERHVHEGQTVRAGEVLFVLALDEQHAVQRRAGAGAAQPGRAPAQPGEAGAAAGPAGRGEMLSLERRLDAMKREQARSTPKPRCTASAWRWPSSRWRGWNR